MAVPGSGSISMLGIFSEKNEDDYSAANLDGENTLSLRGLSSNSYNDSSGGNININSSSSSKPDGNTPHNMSEFRSYDHDFAGASLNNTSVNNVDVFRYFTTPSPDPCSVSLSNATSLGSVRHTPYNITASGTVTKRGSVTSTSSNPTVTQTDINNAVNSWALCSAGTVSNGFAYGRTYYTRIWASSGTPATTVYTDQVTWKFSGPPSVTTSAASSISGGFRMNGNLTDNGLGSSPAPGAVDCIEKKGFVYSTSNSTPTYQGTNTTTSLVSGATSANGGTLGDEGTYNVDISTTTSGTYYIRAFAITTDINTGRQSAQSQIGYGSVVTFTIGPTLYGKPVYPTSQLKKVFACGQTTTLTWYFDDNSPAIGDTVYGDSAGTSTPNAGNYGYKGLGSVGDDTDRRFTINSSGVITDHATC